MQEITRYKLHLQSPENVCHYIQGAAALQAAQVVTYEVLHLVKAENAGKPKTHGFFRDKTHKSNTVLENSSSFGVCR